MGYIENNLIEGERVLYHARLHWIVFIKPALVSVVLLVVAIALFQFHFDDPGSANAALVRKASVLLMLLSAVPLAVGWFLKVSREYAVTNKRVVMQIGVVQRKTEEMFLNKIESISVDQPVGGRMLGYGTVVIRGTGGSFEPFHRVSAPLELRRQIQEQIGKSFEGQQPRV